MGKVTVTDAPGIATETVTLYDPFEPRQDRIVTQKKNSRKYRTAVFAGGSIFAVATAGLGAALGVPYVTGAAVQLGVDGGWWLYAAALSATTVLGYGGLNVWQKSIFAKMEALRPAKGGEE